MNIAVVFAHPDDETMLIGGTLAMLADRGADVWYLSATLGEGGELGEPPITTRADLGRVREDELNCAVRALGGRTVECLGYKDPVIEVGQEGLAFEADFDHLADQIAEFLEKYSVDVAITHGSNGEYGHPAHQLLHRACLQAVQRVPRLVPLYSFSANFPEYPRPRLANQDDPADYIVEIGDYLEAKLAAAQCHQTQHALFIRRSSQEAGRTLVLREVLLRQESLHRHWPQKINALDEPLTRFLIARCLEHVTFCREA